MTIVHGCQLPEHLFYNVEDNVWLRYEEDYVVIGMTSYACSLSGVIVSFLPRKVGKEVRRDASCATVESGKWVGPVKSPVSGEIIETNQNVYAEPSLINEDPYGQGWLVKIRPDHWEQDSKDLLTGQDALAAYKSRMEEDGFGGC